MLVRNRFPQIIAGLNPTVTAAVYAGAKVIEREAKERVPVDSGDLRSAIHTERGGNDVRVIAGDSSVFYGHLVENGTTRTPPRPFLVPAVEASRAEVLALVNGALKRL